MKKLLKAIFVITLVTASAFAQNQDERKIIKMPTVEVPAEAKETGLGGTMTARVTVDRSGKVVSVDGVSGPGFVCQESVRPDVLALREATKRAAIKVLFSSTSYENSESQKTYVSFTFSDNKKEKSDVIELKSEERKDDGNSKVRAYLPGDPPPSREYPRIMKSIVVGIPHSSSKLKKAEYPLVAKFIGVSGTVVLEIIRDEDGNVFSAKPIKGHPLLRYSAIRAACQSKFQPLAQSGNSVMVKTEITYNFVPPASKLQ